jgi:hypothetical protein
MKRPAGLSKLLVAFAAVPVRTVAAGFTFLRGSATTYHLYRSSTGEAGNILDPGWEPLGFKRVGLLICLRA